MVIVFGTPDRSAVIWGITFHPEQFAERHPGGLSIEISYNYYKGGDTHSGFDIFLKISKGSGNTTIDITFVSFPFFKSTFCVIVLCAVVQCHQLRIQCLLPIPTFSLNSVRL